MKRLRLHALVVVVVFGLSLFLSACGSTGSTDSGGVVTQQQQGAMNVAVTDAPGDFDHVYITVAAVWFNTNAGADPRAAGWHKFTLAAPVTIDLLTLANGNMQSIWNNIQLPVGNYEQIRMLLVPTFTADPPTGHNYYNEVVIGSTTYPLCIPDADHGIQLLGAFGVTAGGTLKLAIDFDAGHDVVEFHENKNHVPTDYVLKPILNYYDLDNAGAIVGSLSTTGTFTTTSNYVIKAERLATAQEMLVSGSTSTYHVIRRWTVPNTDGSFILYPVSTLVTTTWDVVVRGLNKQTVIIKGVPITKGATPMNGNATDLGTIEMSPSSSPDYAVAGTIASPTGAWVQFYQTLQAPGEYPYEIRFRHFNPLWGGFHQTFMLNDDQLQIGNYLSSGVVSTLTATTPVEEVGGYQAIAGATLFDRSAPDMVTSATTTVAFTTPLTVISNYSGNSVSGLITLGTTTAMNTKMTGKMDSGLLYAVNGGMIIDAIRVDSQMVSGGTYTIFNLPGGSAGTPLPGAFYGIDADGWLSTDPSGTYRAIAIPQIADLQTGDDTVNIQMLPLW